MSGWHRLWLEAFIFTQLIEVPVYTVALQRNDEALSLPQALLLAFVASLATHPALWFILPPLIEDRAVMVTVGELGVYAVEAGYLWALGVKRFWLWALAANGLSLGFGLLREWIGTF